MIERLKTVSVDQHLGDDVQPLVSGGAVNARKPGQLFASTKNLFDHDVEWFGLRSLRLQQQSPQPLKVLCGIAQPIDMIEPQSFQFALRDQLSDQPMDGFESAGIFNAQSGKRVDIKKAPIVDIA